MHVSTMTIDCATSRVNILGDGLIGDDGLAFINNAGVKLSFVVFINTQYHLQLGNFSPVLNLGGTFKLTYKDRQLFLTVLICPIPDSSGIYYIDASKKLMADAYNGFSKKIPDPTIRIALIGD